VKELANDVIYHSRHRGYRNLVESRTAATLFVRYRHHNRQRSHGGRQV